MVRRSTVPHRVHALARSSSKRPGPEIGYAGPGTASGRGRLATDEIPELRWPRDLAVYDRMRKTDTQIKSVLRAVTSPVLRTNWRIARNGARDEVVETISADLGLPIVGAEDEPLPRRAGRFAFPDHLRMSMLDLPFGHMPFEQVYRVDERGLLRLHKLAPRMPRTISQWDVAADGGLVSIWQDPPPNAVGAKRVEIPVSRLVVYANEREAGNWRGESMLRAAYKFWILKDRMLRVQAQSVERNGLGIPVYEGAPREADLTKGLETAKAWRAGSDAAAAIRNGAKLTAQGVQGRVPDADPVIRYYDEQMARTALLHFLNLGSEKGTGSWALGDVFMNFFVMSLQAIAQSRADVVNEHVIEDLVDLNWGPDEPAPLLVFDEVGSRHPATAEAVKALIDCGAILPDRELEEHLRQQYVLPPKGTYSTPARPAPDPAPATAAAFSGVTAATAAAFAALSSM